MDAIALALSKSQFLKFTAINGYRASNLGASAFAYSAANIRKFIINLAGISALAAGVTVAEGDVARAEPIPSIDARIVATHIPGASAISQVGTFLNVPAHPLPPVTCGNPIRSKFPTYVLPGAILDPNRILVGSRSNFGAPPAIGVGPEGSFLSIDPSGPGILKIPPNFAQRSVLNTRGRRTDVQRE